MAIELTSQGQAVVKCDLCQNPVSFFCRPCGVSLCDPCVPVHLHVKSKTGHDVVDYISKNDNNDACWCDSHPKHECSAFCKTCDVPICLLCVSIKHKSHEISELHDKLDELLKDISRENERLQLFKKELKKLLDHTTKQLSSLTSYYQKRKEEVTARGEEWHKQIDQMVKKLHQKLDNLNDENELVLNKQKKEFEEMIAKMDEMGMKSSILQKSKNVKEMQKFSSMIQEQKTMEEFTQYTFPIFHDCKLDEKYLQTYFGYIENTKKRMISLSGKEFIPQTVSGRKEIEVPTVSSVIETGFPADKTNKHRLSVMAVTDDKKVWMGGASGELKLFDLEGNLQRAVNIACRGMYICMYNKQVVFSDQPNKAVKKIFDDDALLTMFTTGDWTPYGITGSASDDLLVCLRKGNQSKVVRYSSTGTVLQEIQYDSQRQSLYEWVWYIAENVNGDIIVTDYKRKKVITVDKSGIFRYTYSVKNSTSSVTTDPIGHVIVTDTEGDKIHMLDKDGQFLRYTIPEGGIERPRAVCMIGDGEMIVGEVLTGLAKRIRFLEY